MLSSCLFFVVEVEGGGWRSGGGGRSCLGEASWNVSPVEWKLSWELWVTRYGRRSAMVRCWLEVKVVCIMLFSKRAAGGTDCVINIAGWVSGSGVLVNVAR